MKASETEEDAVDEAADEDVAFGPHGSPFLKWLMIASAKSSGNWAARAAFCAASQARAAARSKAPARVGAGGARSPPLG